MFRGGGALKALHRAPKLRVAATPNVRNTLNHDPSNTANFTTKPPDLDFSRTLQSDSISLEESATTPTTPDGCKYQWWSGSADDLISRLLSGNVYDASTTKDSSKEVTLEEALAEFKRDNQIVILCFLRRFGCPVCRAVSAGISRLKNTLLKDANVQVVAVSIEDVGYETFAANEYFTGPVYVNDTGSLFRLLNLKKLQLSNGYDIRKSGKMKAALALASSAYTMDNMNFDGNLVQLGGMFILNAAQDHFLMEFPEAYAGDTPLIHEILTVVNADPELIRAAKESNDRVLNLTRTAALERQDDFANEKNKYL